MTVRLARPDERSRWDEQVDRHHYLGFQRFAGRGLRYVIAWRERWLALAGWQSGAFEPPSGRLGRLVGGTALPAPVPDREQHPVRHPEPTRGLPASRLLGAGPDDATAQRGLGGAVRPPLAGRRELRRPGPVYRHLLPGRELAVSRPYPRIRAPQRPVHGTGAAQASTSTPCGATPASGCATRVRCPPPGSRKGRRRRRRPACARSTRNWPRSGTSGAPSAHTVARCSPSTSWPGSRIAAVGRRRRVRAAAQSGGAAAPGSPPAPAATCRSPSPPCTA